jgi:hypothetical protein
VVKRFIHAISETVAGALEHMQKEVTTELKSVDVTSEGPSRSKFLITAATMKVKNKVDAQSKKGTRVFAVKNMATEARVIDKDIDDSISPPAVAGRGRGKVANKKKLDDDVFGAVKSNGRGRGRGKYTTVINNQNIVNLAAVAKFSSIESPLLRYRFSIFE